MKMNGQVPQEAAKNMLTQIKGRQMRITSYIDAIQAKTKQLADQCQSTDYTDLDAIFAPGPVFDNLACQTVSPRYEMLLPLKVAVRASPSRDNSFETLTEEKEPF